MDNTELAAITRALVVLVNHPDYEGIKSDLLRMARTRYGSFAGDLAPLNPLLDYVRGQGERGSQSLLALGDAKHRQQFGGEPLSLGGRKAETQRRLWTRLTGEKIRSDPGRKREFETEIQALWMLRRDTLLETDGFNITGADRLELVRMYWEDVESQLDAGLKGDETVGRYVLGLDPHTGD
jgi:hypothetical protein